MCCVWLILFHHIFFSSYLASIALIDTFEWGFVGESGAELRATLTVSDLSIPPKRYLVVYGGASSEYGALGGTLYAELPELAAIGTPSLCISSGRSESAVLSDVWVHAHGRVEDAV